MTPRRSLGYNPGLDGLRALAVAGVVVQHAGFEEGGYFGVTVFFVISGYLITGLLLAEHESNGSIGLAAFYRRRFARLAPALLLVTGVITVWLLASGAAFATWWAGLVGTLTYTTDLLLAAPVGSHVGSYFEWSWSLGIEEQFYLFWPLLMIVLLRLRRGRGWLAGLAMVVVALAWLQRARLSHGHPSHDRINFTFDTHMDAIALGALLAIVLLGRPVASRAVRGGAQLLCLIASLALFAVIRQPWQTEHLTTLDVGGYGQVALLCLVIVGGVVMAPTGPVSRMFATPLLVHVGKLSYGIYLWNQLLAGVCEHLTGHLPSRTGFGLVLYVLALLVVAELSYRYVETPLRRRWAKRPSSAPTPDAVDATEGHASG
jgi:peptidoglycan/LPS O-acetylase OafA/YrhL